MEEREIWENRGNRCFCLIDRRKGTKGKAISIALFSFCSRISLQRISVTEPDVGTEKPDISLAGS